MWKKLFGLLVVCIALIGIFDASYLTLSETSGVTPPCRPPFDCGKVLRSPLSHIGPIPLAAIGVLYYATILILGSVAFTSQDHEDLLLVTTGFGFFFSLYLLFTMAFVLQAWCLYCLVSAACCMLIFLFAILVRLLKRDFLAGSTWFSRLFHSLYVLIIKPIFFLFDAEFVHNRLTHTGQVLGSNTVGRSLTAWLFFPKEARHSVTIDGIVFPTRVGLSAGFDYTGSLTSIVSSLGFGFATIGTITNEPYAGNTPPRLGRLPRSKALLVNKGFKNLGARAMIQKLSTLRFDIPIGISIGSTNKIFPSLEAQVMDIVTTFRLFEASEVSHAYYELNISCPNVSNPFSFQTPKEIDVLLSKIDRLHVSRPIYLKMPIDLSTRETLALLTVANTHSIAGVIFGNLTKDKRNPAVHPRDRIQWANSKGNLSGKPTWERSNECIALTKKHFKDRFTIIGTGGIFTPQNAQRKIALGADLVQMITGMIYEGPARVGEIARTLDKKIS